MRISDWSSDVCSSDLVPELNIQVHGNDIHRFGAADIAVAVATDKGLITPIVTRADERSVAEISQLMAGLAPRARSGKLKPEEYSCGRFPLSHTGGGSVRSRAGKACDR